MIRRTLSILPLSTALLLGCAQQAPDGAPLDERASAVVGGYLDDGADKIQGVVLLSVGGGLCTGSLIAPNVVLTARHCVSQNITEGVGCDSNGVSSNGDHVADDLPAAGIGVHLGPTPPFWAEQPAAVGKDIVHPKGKNLCNSDIALIVLSSSIGGVPLMKVRDNYPPQIGEQTTVIGYGLTDENKPWSSGERHRRENVSVLSVGRDWNFLTSENELVTSEGTCQGDSGSPLLTMDTHAVIGVLSRSQDCHGSPQIFTRVDAWMSVVNEALAIAGATLTPEGKSPPAPAEPLPGGSGCTVGSQCADDFCATADGTAYCSMLCSPGGCPSGSLCIEMPENISGGVVDVPICYYPPKDGSCRSCMLPKCKTKVEPCYGNAGCKALSKCVEACSDKACVDACTAANPGAAAMFQPVLDCACSAKCASPCADQCGIMQGTGGAAGAGGASGEGGAAGAAGEAAAGAGAGEGGAAGAGEAGAAGAGEAGTTGTAGAAGAQAGSTGAGAGGGASVGGSSGFGPLGGGGAKQSGGSSGGTAKGGSSAGGGNVAPAVGSSGSGGMATGGSSQAASNPQLSGVGDDSGSEGGCSTSGRQQRGGLALVGLLGALIGLRRRGRR